MAFLHPDWFLPYNQITWINSTFLAKYIDCITSNPKVLHMAGVWLDCGSFWGIKFIVFIRVNSLNLFGQNNDIFLYFSGWVPFNWWQRTRRKKTDKKKTFSRALPHMLWSVWHHLNCVWLFNRHSHKTQQKRRKKWRRKSSVRFSIFDWQLCKKSLAIKSFSSPQILKLA